MARIRHVAPDKPRHGKKRRARQKRHETDVVRELRLHPEESPSEAGRAVRERPPAEVIDVKEGLRRREQRREASPAPPRPRREPASLRERLREEAKARVLHGLEKIVDTTTRWIAIPGEIVRAFRALRHRET